MDSLYRKVFGNKYLNGYIFNFIQNKYIEDDDYVSTYNDIMDSYNVVDLEISELLKKKRYGLLKNMIDNYFIHLIETTTTTTTSTITTKATETNNKNNNKENYWFYILNPTKVDIKRLLRWNELGFKRFKLIYDEFKPTFKSIGSDIIKNAIVSGNLEIVQFLIDQGYKLNIKIHFINSELEKFNCGGNITLFKMLMDALEIHGQPYEKSNLVYLISCKIYYSHNYYFKRQTNNNFYPEQTDPDIVWVSVPPSTTLLYYEVYKSLLTGDVLENNNSCRLICSTSIRNGDLSLAKAYIDLINERNKNSNNTQQQDIKSINNCFSSSFNFNIILNTLNRLILSDPSFTILKFIYENHKDENGNCENKIEDIIKFISKSKFEKTKSIYRLNVETKNKRIACIIDSIIEASLNEREPFIPNSILEFKHILENPKLKLLFSTKLNTKLVLLHISNKVGDLDYLKFVLSYYFPTESTTTTTTNSIETNKTKEILPGFATTYLMDMTESTFEIISWIINSYQKEIKSMEPQPNRYHSCFFGDIKTLELIESVFDNMTLPQNYLENTIINDKLHLFLNTIDRFSFGEKETKRLLYLSYFNNRFEMFRYMMDKKVFKPSSLNLKEILRVPKIDYLNPIFLAYLLRLKQSTTLVTTRQLILESIYRNNYFNFKNNLIYNSSKKYGSHIDNSTNLKTIIINSTKVLDHIFYENSNNGNKSLLVNLFKNKYILSNLIRFNTKKLIGLLNFNNGFGINLFTNDGDIGDLLKSIIKESILSNNYFILNYIVSLKRNNDTFIYNFHLYFLIYSILLVSKNKFKRNTNGIYLNMVSCNKLYSYYQTISKIEQFNLFFKNYVSFSKLSSLLDIFIIKQSQHKNNSFYNFLLNLKNNI